jgi:DNA polymerase-3 subunit alpha
MENLAKEKGRYLYQDIQDDYKFEMKYFLNAKLEALKNLEAYVGKTLSLRITRTASCR